MDTTKDTTMQHVTDAVIEELRMLAEDLYVNGYNRYSSAMSQAADELERLRAKIEAAENDAAHQKALAASALRVAEGWERKCGELRAKVEAMERQEPVAWLHETRRDSDVVTDAVKHVWGKVAVGSMAAYSIPLYALPGARQNHDCG